MNPALNVRMTGRFSDISDSVERAHSDGEVPPIMAVAAKIDHLIETGHFAPGQRLIESDVAEIVGASRGSVREALRYLAGDGVVELVPNRGARVAILSPDQIAELFEFFAGFGRMAMDCLAARPVSQQAKQDLRSTLKRMKAAQSVSNWAVTEAMVDYHNTIIEHCGNRYVQRMGKRLHWKHYARQASSYSSQVGLERAVQAYETITPLLLKRNSRTAFELLAQHHQKAIDAIRRA